MRVLLTGGGGFLGRAILVQLRAAGHQVRVLSRRALPSPADEPVDVVRGDLRDARDVARAVAGSDAVVHCAARTGFWGPSEDFFETNVRGTEHVLAACRRHGVDRLVLTSSPSVVHGGRDLSGVDESVPYATRFTCHYPRTKAIAEQLVLAANGSRLATCALRPHLVWGPGDPHFVPRLAEAARRGRLRQVGPGDRLIDTVYVDNAAHAHVLALGRLEPGSAPAGRTYFITQDDPRPVAATINMWLGAAGLPPEHRRIGVGTARVIAAAGETAWRLGSLPGAPPLTRFLLEHLTTEHWFDIGAARRDLGYAPLVSTARGLERLRASLSGHRIETTPVPDIPDVSEEI
ncbi:NAD-dependent epimerase/dehydratase family protein [Kineosporia mesophila]|uniref:NAD-dependent epimerase/dehydratase family protein n=1 Tax=Kineosporia mesophila TaxID=566012 RepID=A0ABP7AV84_9ACTN|nr:NAD-dependent epimerase/dehydratase family protein [Kineosporia mesophila]